MQDIHGILGGGAAGGGSGGPIFGDRRLRAAAQGLPTSKLSSVPGVTPPTLNSATTTTTTSLSPATSARIAAATGPTAASSVTSPWAVAAGKQKRSSKRKASSPAPPPQAPPSAAVNDLQSKSNSRSSSESTSANTATKDQFAGGFAEGVGSGKVAMVTESASEFSSSPLFKFFKQPPANYAIQEPTKPDCSVTNPDFTPLNDPCGIATGNSGARGIFTEIGDFASFMSGNQNQNLFEFGAGVDVAPFRIHHQNQVNHQHENQQLMRNPTAENWRMEKLDGGDHWRPGVLDQTVHVDLLPNSRSTDGGSDWRGVSGGEDGGVGGGRGHIGNLFDLTPGNSAAHGGHWSQSADQWHESDHLYLPP